MPHVFSMVLQKHPCSPLSYRSAGNFISSLLTSSPTKSTKLVRIHPKTLEEEEYNREELSLGGLKFEKLREMMVEEVGRWKKRVREEEAEEADSDVEGEEQKVVGGAKL